MNQPSASNMLRQLISMPWALFLPLLPIVVLCSLSFHFFVSYYRTPEQIPYWALFFGLPHIVSSFQTACDREYLAIYRALALRVSGLFILPLALYEAGVPPKFILTAFFLLTVYHVIAQQYGIAFAAARLRPSLLSAACKWCTVVLGAIAYFQSYFAPDLEGSELYKTLSMLAEVMTTPLLAVIAGTGCLLIWQARHHRTGAALLALNILLFVFALVLIFETPFLLVGLMLVRILHDATGFVAYIRHDTIRNRTERKNVLYRAFPFLPVWLLNPACALAIAAGLTWLAHEVNFIGWLVMGISTAHYYMESFIWKHGTPHRQHFRMSDT